MYKKIFQGFKVTFSDDGIEILDSYKLVNPEYMKSLLDEMKNDEKASKYFIRSNRSYVNEWISHNVLYYLGIAKERTQHVNLEPNLKWYYKVAYFIIGSIFKIF